MDLGATVCTPRNPCCGVCPWQGQCAAYAAGDPAAYPVKDAPRELPFQVIGVGVVLNDAGEVLIDQRLRETHAGQWQGLTHHEIREQFGDALDQWSSGTDVRPGGGETRREVAQRVRTAVEDQLHGLNGLAEATVVVVTHGGAARAGMCSMLDLPETAWASLGVLANCSWSVMTRSSTQLVAPSWRLVEYNAGSLPEPVLGDDR